MKLTSITYRITAITLALLMFITSAGIMVDMHYCQGQLKTFNFFGKAKSCHEIGEGMKNCPHHKKMMAEKTAKSNSINKKDCCSNKLLHLQSDQDQQLQVDNVVLIRSQLQSFIIAFVATFLNTTIFEIGSESSHAHYKPPLIPRDIYVLLETYLL